MDFSALHDDSAITTCHDRLSELPDSLLISILSLLNMSDVIKTTILSKRWKDLWTTIPCLDFGQEYCDFVRGALAQWKGAKIHKLRALFSWEDPPSSEFADSLLLLAVEKQVEELSMFLGYGVNVCANQRLYSCSFLTKLYLAYFTLRVEERVQWNQLKSLKIECVHSFREHDMNQMLLGAPQLEELVLWSLDFDGSLDIRSSSLKKLEIGRDNSSCAMIFESVVNEELRIWGPNLLSLEISARVLGTCLLQVPSLTDVILCFKDSWEIVRDVIDEDLLPPLEMFHQVFRSIRHVEEVTLSDLCIKLLLNMNEKDMAVQFSNTKFLKLCAGEPEEMLDVLEMFPQLTTLVIELDQDLWYGLEYKKYALRSFASGAIFPSPALLQLKTVEIIWSQYNTSIFPAIEILLQNAHILENMVFHPKSYGDSCDQKLCETSKKKVLSMKRSSLTAEVIVLFKA